MKAIVYERYGSPEVLRVEELEKPAPKDDEVLIKIHAAEATKSDCEMRSFRFAVKWFWLPLRLAFGLTKPKRPVLGGYFAGEIEAVGKNVTKFEKGDPVFGGARLRLGAYAEYVSLPASYTIALKPSNMSFEEAAAVPLGGLNALHFMRKANIRSGEKVLINGAGGSIGMFAVQIAKGLGAEVTAVDHTRKADLLRRVGADHFVDYTKEDFASGGRTYDVVFDMVAGSSYFKCVKVLNAKGRYLMGNPRLSSMFRAFLTSAFTDKSATFAFADEKQEELNALKEMIETGRIRSYIDQVYPMEQAPEAHRKVETEERLGAIVISMGHARTVATKAASKGSRAEQHLFGEDAGV